MAKSPSPKQHYHALATTLRELEADLRWGLDGSPRIPAAWTEIALRPPVPFKERLTLRVDDDVLKFFRAMGRGYLTQMNRVLRSFMEARLAGVVKGAEAAEYKPTMAEMYVTVVEQVTNLTIRRNARAKLGKDTERLDVLIDTAIVELREMEEVLGLAEEERVTK